MEAYGIQFCNLWHLHNNNYIEAVTKDHILKNVEENVGGTG